MRLYVYTFAIAVLAAFFWLVKPASVPLSSPQPLSGNQIGDFVWQDLDEDGLQDSNEPGLDSVRIELFACSDLSAPLQVVFSGSNGAYAFTGLADGDYRIRFLGVPGYNRSPQNSGDNEEIDSDADDMGYTDCFSLSGADTLTNLDAGYTTCLNSGGLFCVANEIVALGDDCFERVRPDLIVRNPKICLDILDVELNWKGILIGDTLTADQVGDTVIATVTNLLNNNFCVARIYVLDNIPPRILSCDTLSALCLDNIDPDSIGGISAEDNCSVPLLSYRDSVVAGTCQDSFLNKVVRHWTVSDESGNTVACDQLIFIYPPGISQVVFPVDRAAVSGNAVSCETEDTGPENTGWPLVQGAPITAGNVCGFRSFFFDQQDPGSCPGTYTILRTWTVRNICTGENRKHEQLIEVIDQSGPRIVCPLDITVGASTQQCSADIFLPAVSVNDNCSVDDSIEVWIYTLFDTIFGRSGWLRNAPVETFDVFVRAVDNCDNISNCQFKITVIDNTPPVALANTQTSMSLDGNGKTTLCWQSVDDGSYDNCEVVAIKIKRGDAPPDVPFTDCVDFDCSDIGQAHTVRMRVYDQTGTFEENDPDARFTEITVEVEVKDSYPPTISCPPDVTFQCWEDYLEIASLSQDSTQGFPVYRDTLLIGYYAGALDNCELDSILVEEVGDPDNCGLANIERHWTAIDASGQRSSCIQRVVLRNDSTFYINDTDCSNADPEDGIIWPCAFVTTECNPDSLDPQFTGEPLLSEDACDLVGINYKDLTVTVQDTACFKIFRTWLVLDWCQPDSLLPLGYVSWEYTQEIKVLNNADPEILSTCQDVTICSEEADCGFAPVSLILSAEDDCTPFEDLNFTYRIDTAANGVYDIMGTGNDASSFFPLGTHRIQWKVEDQCGNLVSCAYDFTVVDCKDPTPVCLNLAAPLDSSSGSVEIPAAAFDDASFDNCTPGAELKFSFSGDVTDTLRTFTCDDLETDTLQQLELWVTDEAGNQDFCSVTLSLQDPSQICQPMAMVAGTLATELDDPVNKVQVNLNNTGSGASQNTLSDKFGQYSFTAPVNNNYSITPYNNDDPSNGVTTIDLVIITQHILGIVPLPSPYKIIAADATNDGLVSTLDIIELRQLILRQKDTFSNNTSWRFVDESYIFPDPEDPFQPPFPERININNLTQDDLDNDFISIKVGDVDGSANTSGLVAPRNSTGENPVTFYWEARKEDAGGDIQIPVYAREQQKMRGFQLGLYLDPGYFKWMEIVSSLPGFGPSNAGWEHTPEGHLLISWHGTAEQSNEEPLFVVRLKPRHQINMLPELGLSGLIYAEAYYIEGRSGLIQHPILLEKLSGVSTNPGPQFFPPSPNPFANQTMIPFHLPENEWVTVEVFDSQGRRVWQQQGWWAAGLQTIYIDAADLPAEGLYLLRMKAGQHHSSARILKTGP